MAASNKRLAVIISAAVSLFSCILSIFSLSAAIVELPASEKTELLRQGKNLPRDQILDVAERSWRAGHIFEGGRYFSDAALAIGRLNATDRQLVLGKTSQLELINAALRSRPASPRNWARRADIQLSRGDVRGARSSLEASMLIGRFVPGLTVPRLAILLKFLQRAPDREMESYFVEQMRIAAKTEPRELAAFANGGAAEGKAQAILSPDFPLYNAYLTALISYRAEHAAQIAGAGK